MKITFLGTGTSHGVPVIGCDCPICQSDNPKNNRTRSSIWIQYDDVNILIDTANEFRIQALHANIKDINAVLYTHCHADHVFGFDDLRIFSQRTGNPIPIYGNENTINEICQVFNYVFRQTQRGGGKPQIIPNIINERFQIEDLEIIPIPIYHGELPILAYRFGNMAYLTDCKYIPSNSKKLLQGLDLLILGVIRYQPHSTHMHVAAALELVEYLQPKKTFFTHISHYLEHDEVNRELPKNIKLAYDGLEITI